MRLDAHTSSIAHADHLAPIWLALHESDRGSFSVDRRILRHALTLGLQPSVRPPDRTSRDPIMLASWGDVRLVGDRSVIMVEHGAGQGYGIEPDPNSEPDWAHSCQLAKILCPSKTVAARNRLHHPHAVSVAVGAAKAEQWRMSRNSARLSDGPDPYKSASDTTGRNIPTVAFAWHWNSDLHPCARWAFPHWSGAVAELAAMTDDERGFRMLGHGHPRAWPTLAKFYGRHGIETAGALETICRADLVVFDTTSFGWESAACGIPVVLLDAPWFDTDGEEWGLRWWRHADAGLRVGSGRVPDLHRAILRTLAEDPCAAARAEAVADTYALVEGATEAAAVAIREYLLSLA